MIGWTGVILLLLGMALVLVCVARALQGRSGLPPGQVVYSDTGAWQPNEHSLFSARYHLSGKPDYLVREGTSIIPIEVKSGLAPPAPRDGHVMQLAVYCLLVEDQLGHCPPYGLIHYADRTYKVAFTDDLRAEVLKLLEQMRHHAALPGGPQRDHLSPGRCRGCGQREACDERLD